jgi:hypothetical protein
VPLDPVGVQEMATRQDNAIDDVDREHAFDRSGDQGQRQRGTDGTSDTGKRSSSTPPVLAGTNSVNRPRRNDVTLSILGRAKAAGFTAFVITFDTC